MHEHDWHAQDYVDDWIARDVTRDAERRPLLRRMLALAPFGPEATLSVIDVGGGYGVVTEEVLRRFPHARVTLQDYSTQMLEHARQRLAAYAGRFRSVLCDLADPGWSRQVGGPFDLAVSAIALHNLRATDKIFACYRAIFDLVGPGGAFLDYDRFPGGIERHLAALREAGFARVDCDWQSPPVAILAARRAPAASDRSDRRSPQEEA